MSAIYKELLADADGGTTGVAVPFTQGVASFIIYGTWATGSTIAIIEASHDNVNFAPVDGLDEIRDPICKTVHMAHSVFIRARIPSHGGGSSSISVILC